MQVSLQRPDSVGERRFFWPYLAVIIAFHLLLPLALIPGLFTWTGLVLVFLGNYVFGSVGINIGYHRLLTHRSFRCPKWLEHGFALWVFARCKARQDAGLQSIGCIISTPTSGLIRTARWSASSGGTWGGWSSRTAISTR